MIIKNARLAFPQLWVAKAFDESQTPRYQATLLLPQDDPQIAKLHEEAAKVAREKWGDRWVRIKEQVQRRYLRDGAEKSQYDGFQDHVFITANNTLRPTIVDQDCSPLLAEDGRPYAGCYVYASIEIWAQDNKWGKALNASLLGVQFARHGESFGGGRVANPSDFDDLSDEETTPVDPLA